MARRATLRPQRPKKRPKETLGAGWQEFDYTPFYGPPAPLGPDPLHTEQLGAINLNYDSILAGVGYDRTALGQHYGFDQQGNLDPSNPYSVAANLQRRYQQGQRGTTNSMAARGQLYSGALQRNLDEGTYQYQRSYDQTRRAAADAYRSLDEREQRAEFERRTGIAEAGADRLARAEQNRPPDPGIPLLPGQKQNLGVEPGRGRAQPKVKKLTYKRKRK